MSDDQSWTIGAHPDCDIVIDDPTVSGRHCRLTTSETGFRLEDLGSTNGTFVNGHRLEAGQPVSREDEIRLGPDVPFSWDALDAVAAERRTILIGRLPDNDVVLDYPMISGHHAELVVEGNRMSIRDLESTNGVAVRSPENWVTESSLSRDETVYFGTLAVPVRQLVDGPANGQPGVGSATAGDRWWKSPRAVGAATALGIALAALVAVASLLPGRADEASPEKRSTAVPVADSGSVADDQAATPAPPAGPIPAAEPARAVYSVLVQDYQTGEFLILGAASAVSEHRLVTSAGVASQLLGDEMRSEFPAAKVRCEALEKEFAIRRAVVHPVFEQARSRELTAAEKADALRTKLESAATNPESASLTREQLKRKAEELIDWEEKRFQAVEQEIYFDVGLLEVEGSLPEILPLRERAAPDEGASLTLVGLGVGHDAKLFNPEEPVAPRRLPATLGEVVRAGTGDRGRSRLMIECKADHHGLDWWGSPLLNADGAVIGVYSRPTAPADPREPPPENRFDAALIRRVKDFAPELWESAPSVTDANDSRT